MLFDLVEIRSERVKIQPALCPVQHPSWSYFSRFEHVVWLVKGTQGHALGLPVCHQCDDELVCDAFQDGHEESKDAAEGGTVLNGGEQPSETNTTGGGDDIDDGASDIIEPIANNGARQIHGENGAKSKVDSHHQVEQCVCWNHKLHIWLSNIWCLATGENFWSSHRQNAMAKFE